MSKLSRFVDPDHPFDTVDSTDQVGEEAVALDPALEHNHAVIDVDEEPVGSIMNSPTITSSMISRRMAWSVG